MLFSHESNVESLSRSRIASDVRIVYSDSIDNFVSPSAASALPWLYESTQ